MSIDVCGYSFLTLVGSHINGGFIALLNWNASAEISDDWNDVHYNSNKIFEAIHNDPVLKDEAKQIAEELAVVIKNYFSKIRERERERI